MMQKIASLVLVAACHSPGAHVDAAPDAPSLDCDTYCTNIQAGCMDTNVQYPDLPSCKNTCLVFSGTGFGASTINDTTGNTLGCRVHAALSAASAQPAASDCAHSGPAGDLLNAASPGACSGDGDFCTSFCAIEIAACGSLDVPLPGNPKDPDGNPLFQYRNMANCVTACAAFDKTHLYVPTAAGNSLACRLLHAVTATSSLASATQHCSSTASTPRDSCAGSPTP